MRRDNSHLSDEQITEMKDILLREKKNTDIKLQKISDSLRKIGSSEYGICGGCKEYIPFHQIKRSPTSNLCMACS